MKRCAELRTDRVLSDCRCWFVGTDSNMKRCAALRTDRVLSDSWCWFVGTDSNMKSCAALRTDCCQTVDVGLSEQTVI